MTQETGKQPAAEGKIPPHPPAHEASSDFDPHVDENLDRGLDETFPASDPTPISPGAD